MARVLVVDDDAAVRESVCDVLQSAGYQTEEAADGVAALEMLERLPEIDCMILDMHMPRLDGMGVLQGLHLGRPTVVVVSAFEYVNPAEVEGRFSERVCAFLVKPVFPGTLIRTVEACTS